MQEQAGSADSTARHWRARGAFWPPTGALDPKANEAFRACTERHGLALDLTDKRIFDLTLRAYWAHEDAAGRPHRKLVDEVIERLPAWLTRLSELHGAVGATPPHLPRLDDKTVAELVDAIRALTALKAGLEADNPRPAAPRRRRGHPTNTLQRGIVAAVRADESLAKCLCENCVATLVTAYCGGIGKKKRPYATDNIVGILDDLGLSRFPNSPRTKPRSKSSPRE